MSIETKLAKEILELVGGKDNIQAYEHCATRLRLILKDADIANDNKGKIDNLDKVKGSFYQSGQFQIILGTGFVNKVYEEIKVLVGESTKDVKTEAYENMNVLQKLSRIFGDVFVPIIPALVATGLFMGLRGALLSLFPAIATEYPDFILLTQVLTDTVFIFLPALVAMYAAKRFGGNQTIGLVAGLMMVAPMLPNAWDVAGGTAEPLMISLGFMSVPVVGYQGSVLPALAIGVIAAKLEKIFRKVVPEFLDLIVTPFLTLLITMIVGLLVIGPIMHELEILLVHTFSALMYLPLGIGAFFIGFFMQFIVVTGLHHAFNALEANLLSTTGVNPWNALVTGSIAAQGAAAIAVALKMKSQKQRTAVLSSSASAFFGITEPSIFGVNLPRFKPFIYGCIGGGVSAVTAYIFGLEGTGMAITVIPGTLLYLNGQILGYLLVHIVAIAVPFALVWFLWDEDKYQKGN